MIVLAPQRQQVLDLQRDGLHAQTVAQVLTTKQLPTKAIIICDEAGQISGRDLHSLINLVRENGGRLILSGDTRQHGAVGASDALRAIERHAGLKPAEITQIRRQDPDLGRTVPERQFIRGYRAAVKNAALGKIAQSFDRLDRLGCIRELAPDERRSILAREYAAAISRSEKALVVAQTWDEVDAVNDAIRETLRSQGKIGDGLTLDAFRVADLDSAQKKDVRSYQPGQHAFFLKGYGRFAKGDLCEIRGANESGVVLRKNGRQSTVSFRYTDRVLVTRAAPMELGPGDRLQLKFNGKSQEGLALANGELVTVRRLGADGSLAVESDAGLLKTLTPNQRLFNRGFATTSYASQGKTVDTVLLSDSGRTPATNDKQWYVCISRARRNVLIFTGNKAELRDQIHKSGDRGLALDLHPGQSRRQSVWDNAITGTSLQPLRLRSLGPRSSRGGSGCIPGYARLFASSLAMVERLAKKMDNLEFARQLPSPCYSEHGSPLDTDILTIHVSAGEIHTLLWSRFASTCHLLDASGERLTLVFPGSQVVVRGRGLAPIARAANRRKLSSLRTIPAPYVARVGPDETIVTHLAVGDVTPVPLREPYLRDVSEDIRSAAG